jgi:RsiW-degrading membrane proteinase PrsW (M82 family)
MATFLLLGGIACFLAYLIASYIFNHFNYDTEEYISYTAPIIEEFLKGFIIVLFALLFQKKEHIRKIVLTSSLAVGFGFAVFENLLKLFQTGGTEELYLIVLRGITTTLLHGICAFIIGMGIYYLKEKTSFVFMTVGLYCVATTLHTCYNTLLYSRYYVLDFIIIPLIYIIFVCCKYFLPRLRAIHLKTNKTAM